MIMLLLCLALIVNCGLVNAGNYENATDVAWEGRRAFVEENMIIIGSQGPEKVEEWLKANGVYKVQSIKSIEPMSTPGSVRLYNIDGYFDSIAKKYLVKGWWTWEGILLVDLTAGAVDGVSLAMCKTDWNPVTGYILASNPAGIAVYDQDGTHYPYAGGASKIDKSGIVYTFQDGWYNQMKYCGYRGQVWFWMNQQPSQLPIYIKMDYMHTWSAAKLSSFGFNWPSNSAPEINLKFDVVPKNFKRANQITLNNWRHY